MAKSISEYKDLKSESQEDQNKVIDNIGSYIGTQVETMLRYLELTYKGMGVIDKFSSFLSNIVPIGTSYNDAVDMITSWGNRASDLRDLYENGNMTKFLALFKSITGMDFSQENILKLEVTNDLMKEYSNFTYEESVNFVSTYGIIPEIKLDDFSIIIMAKQLGVITEEEIIRTLKDDINFSLDDKFRNELICRISLKFDELSQEDILEKLHCDNFDDELHQICVEYMKLHNLTADNFIFSSGNISYIYWCFDTFKQKVENLPLEIILSASGSSVGNSKVSGQAVTNYEKTVAKYTKVINTTATSLAILFTSGAMAGTAVAEKVILKALVKGAIGAIANSSLNGLNDATSEDGLTFEQFLYYAVEGFMQGSFSDLGEGIAERFADIFHLSADIQKYLKNWISIAGKDIVKELIVNSALLQKPIVPKDLFETIILDTIITFGVTGLETVIKNVSNSLSKTVKIKDAVKNNKIDIEKLPDSQGKTILQKILEGKNLTYEEKAIFYGNYEKFMAYAEGTGDLSGVVADAKIIEKVWTTVKDVITREAQRKGKNFSKSLLKGGFTWYWSVGSSDIDMTGDIIVDEDTINKSKDWLKV